MDRYTNGVIVRPGRHPVNALIQNSATVPNAWTEKDVSEYVGQRKVLLLLRGRETNGMGVTIITRASDNPYNRTSTTHALGSVKLPPGAFGEWMVETGPTGIFEWRANIAWTFSAWLISYFD